MGARSFFVGLTAVGLTAVALAACGARTSLLPPGSGGGDPGRDGGIVGDAAPPRGDGGVPGDAGPRRDGGGPAPMDAGPVPPPPVDAGMPSRCVIAEQRQLAESDDGPMQWPTASYLGERGLVVFTQHRPGMGQTMLRALPLGPEGQPAGTIVPLAAGEGGTVHSVPFAGIHVLLARSPGSIPIVMLLDELGNLVEGPDTPFGELRTDTIQPGFVVSPEVIGVGLSRGGRSTGIVGRPEGGTGAFVDLRGDQPWAALSSELGNVVLFSTILGPELQLRAVDNEGMRVGGVVSDVMLEGELLAGRVIESRTDGTFAVTSDGVEGFLIGIGREGEIRTRPTTDPLTHVAAVEHPEGAWVLAAGAGPGVIQLFATDGGRDFAQRLPAFEMVPRPAVVALPELDRFLVIWSGMDGSGFTLESAVVRCR